MIFGTIMPYTERICCKLHWECTTLYTKMPLLIELMFSEDITRLHINLRKAIDLSGILESLLKRMQKLPKRDYIAKIPQLRWGHRKLYCTD